MSVEHGGPKFSPGQKVEVNVGGLGGASQKWIQGTVVGPENDPRSKIERFGTYFFGLKTVFVQVGDEEIAYGFESGHQIRSVEEKDNS